MRDLRSDRAGEPRSPDPRGEAGDETELRDYRDQAGGAGEQVRRLLLALLLFGAVGMLVDLLLLEHFETIWQWIPIALLVPVIAIMVAALIRPGRRVVRALQGVMAVCVAAGLLGVYLHYQGNLEFELERDPELRGLALVWETIRGATPALAPGALVQLGLLGLAYAFRHPSLRTTTVVRAGSADIHSKEPR